MKLYQSAIKSISVFALVFSLSFGALSEPLVLSSSESLTILSSETLIADQLSTNNGSISNEGYLGNIGYFNNSGQIDNYGQGFLSNSGTFNNSSYLINNYDQSFLSNSGTFNNSAPIKNYGTFANTASGTFTNDSSIYSYGSLSTAGTFYNNNYIYLQQAGSYNSTTTATNSGNFINNGSISSGYDTNAYFSNATGGQFTNYGVVDVSNINNSGTWNQYGDFYSYQNFSNSGVLNVYNWLDIGDGSFINSGTVNSDSTLNINQGASLLNQSTGVLNLNSGTIISGQLQSSGRIENTSYISINQGSLSSSGQFINNGLVDGYGGSFTNGSGGTVTNNGGINLKEITNAGIWYDNSSLGFTESLQNSGTLYANNGFYVGYQSTVVNSGALYSSVSFYTDYESIVINSGIIETNGASINGDFVSQGSGIVRNTGQLDLTGTISNSGQLLNSSSINNNGGSFSNSGLVTNNGDFNNAGTFLIADGAVFNGDGSFNQSFGLSIINGTLEQQIINIFGGELQGNGTLTSSAGTTNLSSVSINPGNSVGELEFTGTTNFDGELNIEIESLLSFDSIIFEDVNFGENASIHFIFDSLFDGGAGDLIEFLFADNLTGFENIQISSTGLNSELAISLIETSGSLSLGLITAVPLPPALLFYISCLVVLRVGQQWIKSS